MIHTILPYNPVINSMRYHNEVIYIEFKKAKGKSETRSYRINIEAAYKLFYSKTATQCLKAYNVIKDKGTFIEVKPI